MTEHPSVARNAGNPGLTLSLLSAGRRLAVPSWLDPLSVSPLRFGRLAGLPPARIVTGGLDPVEDHGRRYAERLRAEGTDARLSCYPEAIHGFLSMPGLVPAARPARREILAFLRDHLSRHDPVRRPHLTE